MQSDFLAKVHTMYNQFTKAEKKVADFILQNPKRVLFMSITELADECKVGDTSVFRFCRTMGVKGYQEFKMQLSLSIHDGKEEESRLAGETSLEDSFSELAKKVLNTNMKALAETYSLLDEKVVSQTDGYPSCCGTDLVFWRGSQPSGGLESSEQVSED